MAEALGPQRSCPAPSTAGRVARDDVRRALFGRFARGLDQERRSPPDSSLGFTYPSVLRLPHVIARTLRQIGGRPNTPRQDAMTKERGSA